MIPARKYKVKVVCWPNSSNATAQPPLANPKASENPEGQRPSTVGTLGNNPPPLQNIQVCTSTPWPEVGKMSVNLFELRKVWPIPHTNNTVIPTYSKPPIKIESQHKSNQPPVQQHPQKQNNVDGDQIVQFAKI